MTNTQYLLWWKMTSPLHIGQCRLFVVQWARSTLLKKLKFSYKLFSRNFTIVTEHHLAPSHSKTQTWAWNRVVCSHARWSPRWAGMCLSKWKWHFTIFVVLVGHRRGAWPTLYSKLGFAWAAVRVQTKAEEKCANWKSRLRTVLRLRRCFPLRPQLLLGVALSFPYLI